MNPLVPENFSEIVGKVPKTIIVSAKEQCFGILGVELLFMIAVLVLLNFVMIFYWRTLRERQFNLWGKKFDLLYLLPLINFGLGVFIFVYAWNAW